MYSKSSASHNNNMLPQRQINWNNTCHFHRNIESMGDKKCTHKSPAFWLCTGTKIWLPWWRTNKNYLLLSMFTHVIYIFLQNYVFKFRVSYIRIALLLLLVLLLIQLHLSCHRGASWHLVMCASVHQLLCCHHGAPWHLWPSADGLPPWSPVTSVSISWWAAPVTVVLVSEPGEATICWHL